MAVHPRAGQHADDGDLVDVAELVTAYYTEHPDMMLGKMESTGKMHKASGQPQLVSDGRPLAKAMP